MMISNESQVHEEPTESVGGIVIDVLSLVGLHLADLRVKAHQNPKVK